MVITDAVDMRELQRGLRALGAKTPATGSVVVDQPPWPRRDVSATRIRGPKRAVEQHVSWLLGNDTYTPHYEHMALTVVRLEVDDGLVSVWLTKNRYAGD